jgi:hypothetical protein
MSSNPYPQIYRFVIVDAPPIPIELSARFSDAVGKPGHRQQALLHALDLSVRFNRSRVAIYHGDARVTTVGKSPFETTTVGTVIASILSHR